MEAYPNVRVKSNLEWVWQQIRSKDRYTFDIGMKPTEMFMRFQNREWLTFDGTSTVISTNSFSFQNLSEANILSYDENYFDLDGYLRLHKPGTSFSLIGFMNDDRVTYDALFYLGATTFNFTTNNNLDIIFDSDDDIQFNASDAVVFNSDTSDYKISDLVTNDSETYLVAVDPSDGALSKRSVASIGGGGGGGSDEDRVLVAKATIDYTTSTVPVGTLPANSVIWDVKVEVTEAFNDSSYDLLTVGYTADVDHYLPEYDVSSTGWNSSLYTVGYVEYRDNIPERLDAETTVRAYYTGANADASTGSATVYVHYSTHS
jgi:hypothetical protein